MMELEPYLEKFFVAIVDDSRISATHISLFMAIMQHWNANGRINPICVFARDLMRLAKISSGATYYKVVKELSEYGYIKYEPSFNHFSRSKFYLKSCFDAKSFFPKKK